MFISGCWDKREINELGIVTAVGVDKGKGENRYSVTIEIANTPPKKSGNSGSDGNETNKAWVGNAEGKSIFDAVRVLSNSSSRRIMWAHNSLIIIGEKARS